MLRAMTTVLGLLTFMGAADAHHSQVGIFNSRQTVEITGVIKSISWRNPHGQILIDVTNDDGSVTTWDAETASISVMRNRGFEPSAVVVGDRVTLAGSPSTRNRAEILARSMLLPSGDEFTFGNQEPYFAAGKAGHIAGRAVTDAIAADAIANADGIYRVWSTIMSDPDAFPMFKGGYPLSAAGKAGAREREAPQAPATSERSTRTALRAGETTARAVTESCPRAATTRPMSA